ncbi:hypothetical protein JCM30471_27120 [Desulfuromonas carbonis]|uniref:M48 family metalloprotease n=1 Tax=Desulfuromonas sp. DDH964 TaxID=1823759 RepID=UPI00078BB62B|nr:M48 family metalloprotease [Desulfuromonas sp. DDH964]AMV70905.1 peptidase lipoprotein, M48 family [Desulfuromonas sp. DDH964]
MNGGSNYCRTLWALIFCGLALPLLWFLPAEAANQEYRLRVSQQQEAFQDLDDVRAEIAFGREVAAHLLGQYGLYDDEEMTRYVTLVGQGLILYCGRPDLEYHFAILDRDEPNAFAAPGGYVFVTRGALAVMTDESELAAVLGHEIGHINEKHIVHELKIRGREEQGGALLSSLIGGTTDPMRVAFSQMVDIATDILLKRGYKQEDEETADRLGVTIPAMTGYDPTAMIRFLNTLSARADSTTAPVLGTHRANAVRISELKEFLHDNDLVEKSSNTLQERFAAHVRF